MQKRLLRTFVLLLLTICLAGSTVLAAESLYLKKTTYARTKPSGAAKKAGKVYKYQKVKRYAISGAWSKIKLKGKYVYVKESSLTTKAPKYTQKSTPKKDSFKSYMSYKAITSKSSPQYKLQKKAKNGKYGIRMVDDRYCVALGSYYTTKIGTKLDVVLKNGTVIKCILGDQKANRDTDSKHQKTDDGSVVEFLVNTGKLSKSAKRMGDISYCTKSWRGNIDYIKIYK